MSPRPSHTDRPRIREGLSFAFPMQLPPAGTGAGSTQGPGKPQADESRRNQAPQKR